MVSNKLLKNLRWLTTDMNADRLEITIREGKSILALCARIEELERDLRQIANMPWPNSEAPYARIARAALAGETKEAKHG